MSSIRRTMAFILLLGFFSTSPAPIRAQSKDAHSYPEEKPDCGSPQYGFLNVDTNKHGFAEFTLDVCVPSASEPALRQQLPIAVGCQPESTDYRVQKNDELTALEIDCEIQLPRKTFQVAGPIDLSSAQNILKAAGVVGLTVDIWLPRYGAPSCTPAPKQDAWSEDGLDCTYFLYDTADSPRIIYLSFGYDSAHLLRIAAILGFLLFIPIALTIWFRRRAIGVPEESRPTVVFAYRRFLNATLLGGALIWWTAIDLLHADSLIQLVLPAVNSDDIGISMFLPWILLWLPPLLIYFLCLALSSPIHALRGMSRTPAQAIGQSFWTVARFLPLPFLLLGVAELFSSPRIGVLLIAAAIFGGRLVRQKFAQALGMKLQAVTTGELRDRAFAIAQKARAKLNQLYVLPAERLRMANAFAHMAHNIFLTDYLLQNLDKREVDAVIGHEMAHIQKKHIRTRMIVVLALIVAGAVAAAWSEQWTPREFPMGPVVYAVILFMMFFVSRLNEFAADAGAVALTGDAEAMITALARISRLNTMPMHWGKLDEKMLSHPSTMRRIRRLARSAGISEARIPDLLSQSAVPPLIVYPIPASAQQSGKLFSTQFKAQASWYHSWILIIVTALVPCFVALAAASLGLSGRNLWLFDLAGFGLTIACCLFVFDFLPFVGGSKLESQLRTRLQEQSAPPALQKGLFVSFAPHSAPRIYESNWAWDVGFLATSADRLYYWGEETRFGLRRDQITRVSLGPGSLGWFKTFSAYVTWSDDSGTSRTFNLRPFRPASVLAMARNTKKLTEELDRWHRGIPLSDGSLLSTQATNSTPEGAFDAPSIGLVTSASPRALASGRHLARIFLWDTFIAAGVAILWGLRAPILDTIVASPRAGDLHASGGSFLYVLATVWIVRASLLWPFRRFRESRNTTAAPIVAPSPVPSTEVSP
ncbi:MAG: M48 family metalloprotease [Candidatus Acidiferrales bacterium]